VQPRAVSLFVQISSSLYIYYFWTNSTLCFTTRCVTPRGFTVRPNFLFFIYLLFLDELTSSSTTRCITSRGFTVRPNFLFFIYLLFLDELHFRLYNALYNLARFHCSSKFPLLSISTIFGRTSRLTANLFYLLFFTYKTP
jgi:hypothetical protein